MSESKSGQAETPSDKSGDADVSNSSTPLMQTSNKKRKQPERSTKQKSAKRLCFGKFKDDSKSSSDSEEDESKNKSSQLSLPSSPSSPSSASSASEKDNASDYNPSSSELESEEDCEGPSATGSNHDTSPPLLARRNHIESNNILKITDMRIVNGKRQYLVKWKPTWEPKKNVTCTKLVEKFDEVKVLRKTRNHKESYYVLPQSRIYEAENSDICSTSTYITSDDEEEDEEDDDDSSCFSVSLGNPNQTN